MNQNLMLTILSPAYNKGNTIRRTFQSLLDQTCYDFEWLIVNDGSKDDTKSIVQKIKTDLFPVRFIDKENEGLNRTFNRGVREAKGKYILRLDPDDFLVNNAVQLTLVKLREVELDPTLCGVTFLTKYSTGEIIGWHPFKKEFKTNFFDYRIRYRAKGDKCEVVKTDILRAHPMPEIEGEKFCRESYMWNNIAMEYDTLYIPIAIYVREYDSNSISSNAVRIYSKNPKGMMLCNAHNVKLILKRKDKYHHFVDIMRSGINFYRFGLYSDLPFSKIFKELPWLVSLLSLFPGWVIHYIDQFNPTYINKGLKFLRKHHIKL